MKLRVNCGHGPAFHMETAPSRLPDMHTAATPQAGAVSKSRRVCERVASNPPTPRAGQRTASHFGEGVGMDLSSADDLARA